ncbi:hypothetical protein ACWCZ5_32100 [Streptomyces sp. NPDC001667]
MTDRRTQVLADATRQRRERAIAAIAADAGVSTDFIYKHPAIRPKVEDLRRSRAGTVPSTARPADADAAESTLIRRLTQQLAQARKQHQEQIAELRTALETAHGELLVLRRQLADQQ